MIIEYKNDRYDVKEVTLQDLIINNFPPRSLIALLDASSKEFNTMLSDKLCNSIILPVEELSFCFTLWPQWFIENGFAKKEETKLEPGMVLVSYDCGKIRELVVLTDYKLYCSYGWLDENMNTKASYNLDKTTIEELNRKSLYDWEIKEI